MDTDSDLVEALPVEGHSSRLLDLQQAEQIDDNENLAMDRKRRTNRQVQSFFVLGALVLVGVVLGLIFCLQSNSSGEGSTPSSSSSTPTPPPVLSLRTTFENMLPDYTLRAIKEDPTSAQRSAYDWIMRDTDELSVYLDQDWRVKQRFALATLWYATNGRNWENKMDWVADSETHECELQHKPVMFLPGTAFNTSYVYQPNISIPCNTEGQYQELWLWANNLEGSLPPEIFWIASLRSISIESQTDDLDHSHDPRPGYDGQAQMIFSNTVTGKLSSDFGRLTNLEVLALTLNTMWGTLPTEIGLLTSLRRLKLSDNWFSGSIISELGLLSNLVELAFGSNEFTGPLPIEIYNLTKLERFDISPTSDKSNSVSGEINSMIGLMTNLRSLGLGSNQFSGTVPTELFQLRELERLNLAGVYGSGTIHTELGLLRSVTMLDLSDNHNMTGPLPSQIGELQDLHTLTLYGTPMFSSLPSELGLCTLLAHFDAGETSFTGTLPTEIGLLTMLTYLSLYSSMLSGTLPSEIGNLSKLKTLDLYDNNEITGTVPESLFSLASRGSLSNLLLSGTQLVGTIPYEMFSMTGLSCSSPMCGCDDECPASFKDYVSYLLQEKPSLKRIETPGVYLTGIIPSSIGLFSDLHWLEIGYSGLEGSIPTTIGLLSDLARLKLDCNCSSELPSQLGLLTSVKDMWIGGSFNGTIPTELGRLSMMTSLYLGGELTGTLPAELGQLEAIQDMDWSYRVLTGELPSTFGLLQALTRLQLGYNLFSGKLPSELGKLVLLEELDLSANLLSGTIPNEFARLTSLSSLMLSNNSLTGTLPSQLGDLAMSGSLTQVYLENTLISGALPTGFLPWDSLGLQCGFPLCGCYEACPVSADGYFSLLPQNTGEYALTSLSMTEAYLSSIPTLIGRLTALEYVVFENVVNGTRRRDCPLR